MDILNKLREELQVERWQVEAAVKLIDVYYDQRGSTGIQYLY